MTWTQEEIRRHWERLAREHGAELAATTKTPTIKRLEVDALYRALRLAGVDEQASADLLEAGCGNGRNCFALAERLPRCTFTGIDYVGEMIESARALLRGGAGDAARIRFEAGDVLALARVPDLVAVDEFAALHDLVLYVLGPATGGGTIDYEHPLLDPATRLALARGGIPLECRGVGQNRLFVFRRR